MAVKEMRLRYNEYKPFPKDVTVLNVQRVRSNGKLKDVRFKVKHHELKIKSRTQTGKCKVVVTFETHPVVLKSNTIQAWPLAVKPEVILPQGAPKQPKT